MLRNERHFNETDFKKDLSALPFSIVYSIDEPDEKLDIFNSLFKSCLDKHAPLRRTKITRPPAPWLNKDNIRELQKERNQLRYLAHKTSLSCVWDKFREVRNEIKTKIKSVKRAFYRQALSSSKPKELWNIIHRVLHPSSRPIKADPNVLNEHFSSTSQRILGSVAMSPESLSQLIDSLPSHPDKSMFDLRHVTFNEVLNQLTTIRADCSTGPDQIPAKYLKLGAEIIASPLTHILNSFIENRSFPKAWKVARVSPVPKVDSPFESDDYRPIAILPALSKVYEKLVLSQLLSYIEHHRLLNSNIASYRKGHSITTVLLRVKDDIVKAMRKGEVTLIAFADFSRAFDTVDYSVIIRKLHAIGMSRAALRWIMNYLCSRKQFVQVNDKKSEVVAVEFGVPQGSILGPFLFNLYVNDMQNDLQEGSTCFQYADDTTVYRHSFPKHLDDCVQKMNESLRSIEIWATNNNMLLNEKKTKQMIITTSQMSKTHSLSNLVPPNVIKNRTLDRVRSFKLLGTWISEDFKWSYHINQVVSSCYKILATLRRIKNMTPQNIKKNLAQSLVLSKLNFNDVVTYPLPAFLQKKVQRVQNAAASFVLNRFCSGKDVLKLGWLPTLENTQYNVLKQIHKALYSELWPDYLKIVRHDPARELRSSRAPLLQIPLIKGTFQDSAANLFNAMPVEIRTCHDFNIFKKECLIILRARAEERVALK